MNEALVKCLKDAGQPTERLLSPDGSEVLVLQHGGRVLGLFAAGSDENFFWTNDALKSPAAAKAFYAGNEWHNSGGDRTWLAPELDLFFPDYPSLDRYFQPRQLDPGNYQIAKTADGMRLVNRLTVTPARSGKPVELEMGKSLSWAPNPLRYERGLKGLCDIEYAGYTQHTSLAIVGSPVARVGAWNLIQMPHGGDLLVPVHARTQPKIYFGAISPEDLIVGDRLVRYRMRTDDCHKIGVRAIATTGRVGYLYQTGGESALVIRNFFVNPSGDYVDVPWPTPTISATRSSRATSFTRRSERSVSWNITSRPSVKARDAPAATIGLRSGRSAARRNRFAPWPGYYCLLRHR